MPDQADHPEQLLRQSGPHRHGFVLVVCYKNKGNAGFTLQPLQLVAHSLARLQIKC